MKTRLTKKMTIFFTAFILIALYSFVTDNNDISNSKTHDNLLKPIEEEKDHTDGIFLITNQSRTKSGTSEVLRFYNQHTSVIRFREVVLNDKIKSLSIMNEKSLTLNLFEDAYYTAALKNAYTNIDGTMTVTAMIDKYEQGYLVITTFQNRSLVNIYIPETSKYYQIISDPITNMHFLIEIHPSDLDYIQNGPPLIPEIFKETGLPEQRRIKLELETKRKGPNDPANIDVMIIYTPAAKNWADNSGGGIQNVVAQAIAESQLVFSNSLTIITNTLVHTAQVNYTESGNSYTDISRLQNQYDNYMDTIHSWRDNCAADVVILFTYTQDVGGLGYTLNDINGIPSWAFALCRIQQVANTYTLIHEMGHIMGCDHHKQQLQFPGPTNWNNWPLNTWSAGWKWTGNDNGKYCTVMTYADGSYFPDGITHTKVPYFSNPAINYQGVATGHSLDGDNARTLKEIKHVVEAYRPLPVEKDFGDAPEGALAYPATGVFGQFPTCKNAGIPGSWIEHTGGNALLGHSWDGELDGNSSVCPLFNPGMYNMDECFDDFTFDAGLQWPHAYTVTGSIGAETVLMCPSLMAHHRGLILGYPCNQAVWGVNIDVVVNNSLISDAYLNVLFDWNQDGIWGGISNCQGINTPEHVLVNFQVPSNYNGNLQFLTPPAFTIGPNSGYVWARFTISEQPVPIPWDGSGSFDEGETEDYLLRVAEALPEGDLDFGDAPGSNYATLLFDYGAYHLIDGITYLGARIDSESDGQPHHYAQGDDKNGLSDEDGVIFTSLLIPGKQAIVKVNSSTNCKLNAWINFDFDEQWVTPGEQIFIDQTLNQGLNTLYFNVPAFARLGKSFARFRVNQSGGLDYYGNGGAGEVEDYRVFIVNPGDSSKMHWPQLPGIGGCVLEFANSRLADEFLCTQSGPVNFIRFWIGHQMNNITPTGDFTIEIYSDTSFLGFGQINKPGTLLWSRTFQPGDYNETQMPDDLQCWFSSPPNWVYQPNDHDKWTQITIGNVIDPFIQTRGEIYWLAIRFNSNWQYKGWKMASWNQVQQTFNRGEILWYNASSQDWIGWSGDLAFVINNVIPQDLPIQDVTIPGGQNRCFAATQTITTAGGGTNFITQNGIYVYLIAGQNIIMKEGTHFQSGSYVHAYIDQTGEFCSNPKTIVFPVFESTIPEVAPVEILKSQQMFFKVYPNPTTGQLTLILQDVSETADLTVEIFSMSGEKVMGIELPAMKQYLFDLSAKQRGVYLIRIIKGDDVGIKKLIKL